MINVENLKASLKQAAEPVPYAVLLLNLLDQPLQEGITINEMRKSIALLEKINNAVEYDLPSFEITEDELNKIKNTVENAQWRIIDKGIIDFSDYITNLK